MLGIDQTHFRGDLESLPRRPVASVSIIPGISIKLYSVGFGLWVAISVAKYEKEGNTLMGWLAEVPFAIISRAFNLV